MQSNIAYSNSSAQFYSLFIKIASARMLFMDDFRHIEIKHEGYKRGECSICHKRFGTVNSANRHQRTMHPN